MVTVMGMAIVFLTLIVLMLVTMGLERLFRTREAQVQPAPVAEEAGAESTLEMGQEIAAAISVAIATLLEEGRVGQLLQPAVTLPTGQEGSLWRKFSRQQILISRQRGKLRW